MPAQILIVYMSATMIPETQKTSQDRALNTTLSTYISSAIKHPLLNANEEIELSRKIQLMTSLEVMRVELEKTLDRAPSLEEWANEVNLSPLELQRHINQGKLAKKKLIECNLRWVLKIARKYQDKGLDLLDLIQEGSLGLVNAAEKYDFLRGCRFSTHSYWWIRQSITRAITEKSRMIRLPVHRFEKRAKIGKAIAALRSVDCQTPTIAALSEATGLNEAEIKNTQDTPSQQIPLSLDKLLNGDDGSTLMNCLGVPDTCVEDDDSQSYLKGCAIDLLRNSQLTDEECAIVSLTFGLESEPLKLKEVSELMGKSVSMIRHVKASAMRKMKRRSQGMSFSDVAGG